MILFPGLPCTTDCPPWVSFLVTRHNKLFLLCHSCFFTWLPFVCPEVPTSAGPPVLSGTCLSMDGHHHKNEESWHDGCRECYCHNGKEMCALITCPVPACGNPTIRPGQCCPSCAGKSGLPHYCATTSSLVGPGTCLRLWGKCGVSPRDTSQLSVASVINSHRLSRLV